MQHRIIISGGGTGGHIYPALSIAGALKKIEPDIEILFVGAEGKMEMEKVPAAGYRIIGLPVAGLQRRLTAANLSVPFKVLKSVCKAGRIIKEFRPDAVVGVGGYASAPMLWRAEAKGIPTLIQEQNSYAGLTNKIVGKKARRICVAYSGMERFFPADRILMTGNPIRDNMHPCTDEERRAGQEMFSLNPSLPTVLIVGGSGGCGTFNSVMSTACRKNSGKFPYQIIWQSGKGYASSVSKLFGTLEGTFEKDGLRICGNVRNCDFQTHNAMALVDQDAASLVCDDRAAADLFPAIEELLADRQRIAELEQNILRLARPDAAAVIAGEILALIR